MAQIPPSESTPPEPDSLTSEKDSIRKSAEEYVDDRASASIDKSEYEQRGKTAPETPGGEEGAQPAQ